MTLRCKEGDLALVLHDEPGGEPNIGRWSRCADPFKSVAV
jgi:hypothetical protein